MRYEIDWMIRPRTMIRALGATLLAGLWLVPRVSLGDPPKLSERSVSVVALDVRKELDRKFSEGLGLRDGGATEVTMVLSIPDREVFALDLKSAALTAFTDDKGTNLLPPGRRGNATPLQGGGISSDGHRAKVALQSYVPPAEGATKLVVKGTIPASCGADLKQVRQNEVSLLEGTKFKLGSLELEVAKSPTAPFDDSAMTVRLKNNASLRPIKSLRFLSSSGKEIKSQPMGSSFRRSNKTIVETRDFALWEKADSVTVEAEMFTQTETIQIPISLEISVGLGSPVCAGK